MNEWSDTLGTKHRWFWQFLELEKRWVFLQYVFSFKFHHNNNSSNIIVIVRCESCVPGTVLTDLYTFQGNDLILMTILSDRSCYSQVRRLRFREGIYTLLKGVSFELVSGRLGIRTQILWLWSSFIKLVHCVASLRKALFSSFHWWGFWDSDRLTNCPIVT